MFFLLIFISGCGNNTQQHAVLHLYSDATSISGTSTLLDYEKGQEPPSGLSYPHDDALWLVEHQGKQALRFESTVLGQLRGSLHLFHQPIGGKEFELTCSSWLELQMEESWTGITFWMQSNDVRAMGVRWKPSYKTNTVTCEIFQYTKPELHVLQTKTYPIDISRWADIKLVVKENTVSIQVDDLEPLATGVDETLFIGDNFGLFQGEGTGYFADLQWASNNESHTITRWKNWNQEMVNTTKSVVLESGYYVTPENFIGLDVPVRRIKLANEWRSVVPVQCPSELRFDVHIPPNAKLHVGYGIVQPFALSNTRAVAEVAVAMNGNETIIAQQDFQPRQESPRWFRYHDIHESLQEYANRDVSLILRVKPVEGEEPLVMCWSEPIITTQKKNKRPNVLLVMIDTLRADHVGLYKQDKSLTPIIDDFAKKGTTFRNAISQAPWTTPSHASIFTGLYPSETNCDHTSNSNNNLLKEGYWTWAEILQENGYATSAFTSGLQVRGALGFQQGFDEYHEIDYDSSYSVEANYEQFSSWLDERQGSPWFSFMHTYAVHEPYHHRQYTDYRSLVRSWDDRRQYWHDAYEGGVRFTDEWFGVFLRDLKERGELDNTIIIITSDHGESLGDRLMPIPAPHGHSLYDELLRVPLIIVAPDGVPKNKIVNNQVRLIDLLPTVLELVGIDKPVWCHGLNLQPVMNGSEKLERPAISEGVNYGFPLRSLRTSTHKLITLTDPNQTLDKTSTLVPVPKPSSLQLYDLVDDPQELKNIQEQNQSKLHELNTVMQILTSSENLYDPSFFTSGVIQQPPQPSAKMMEQLNSLGYVSN